MSFCPFVVRELFLNVTVALRALKRVQFQLVNLVEREFIETVLGFILAREGKVANAASGSVAWGPGAPSRSFLRKTSCPGGLTPAWTFPGFARVLCHVCVEAQP